MNKHTISKQSSTDNSTNIESTAIYIALISGAVGFLVSLALFWGHTTALFTKGISIGFVASILAAVIALVIYVLTNARTARKASRKRKLSEHIGTWSIAIVHALLILLTYALIFFIVGRSFIGAEIDPFGSSTIVALATGMAGYITYLSAAQMNSMRIAVLLALFLVSGTFISMLSASDPNWWYVHFSSLGADSGVSSYAFNGTLIIAGVAMVGLTKHITDDFKKLQHEKGLAKRTKAKALTICIVGIGIMLALVGAFVYNVFPTIHNLAAGGMAIFFLLIILALPWLTPDFPKAFFVASYGLFAALLLSVWLYQTAGYFNLTIFELVAAAIIFTWLIVFVRYIAAMLEDRDTINSEIIHGGQL